MSRRASLNTAQVEEARALRADGLSYRQIGAQLGVGKDAAARALADTAQEATGATESGPALEQVLGQPLPAPTDPERFVPPPQVYPPGHGRCGHCSAPVRLDKFWEHGCLIPDPPDLDDEPPRRDWLWRVQW